MINVLIVSKSINCWKDLINNVISQNEDLKLVAVATNKKEMNKIISKIHIDIILMNVKFSEINKFINSKVISENLNPYSIIFVSDDIIDKNLHSNRYFYEFVKYKENNFKDIISATNTLANIKINPTLLNSKKDIFEDIIRGKINNELKYLGYNPSYIGTKYLIEAIYILYNSDNYYNNNLEKDIYPIIARKYNKSINNIKCNIINSTNAMYFDSEEEKLMNYLKEYSLPKPGPKKIILSILETIKHNEMIDKNLIKQ